MIPKILNARNSKLIITYCCIGQIFLNHSSSLKLIFLADISQKLQYLFPFWEDSPSLRQILGEYQPKTYGRMQTEPFCLKLHNSRSSLDMDGTLIFYICNILGYNLANSESCLVLRLLWGAKLSNLSQNGHVWVTQWPSSSGVKIKFDPTFERCELLRSYKCMLLRSSLSHTKL